MTFKQGMAEPLQDSAMAVAREEVIALRLAYRTVPRKASASMGLIK